MRCSVRLASAIACPVCIFESPTLAAVASDPRDAPSTRSSGVITMYPGVMASGTRSSSWRHAKVNMELAEECNSPRTTTASRRGNSHSFIRVLDSVKCPGLRRIEGTRSPCQREEGSGVESMARMRGGQNSSWFNGYDWPFREPGGIRSDHLAFLFDFNDVYLCHQSSFAYISALMRREESFARCGS